MRGGNAFIAYLTIHTICGFAGYVIARLKNRSAVWFFICFFFSLIGLFVLAVLPKRAPQEIVASTTGYDSAKWNTLVASDPDIAAGVQRLRPYGEQYVKELASSLLKNQEKKDFASVFEPIFAQARSDADLIAEGERLDHIGRCVDYVYRSPRGFVAQLKDGRALAQSGDDFKLFDSLGDYREAYQDQGMWEELTALNDKRKLFARAHASLEQINASADPGKRQAASSKGA